MLNISILLWIWISILLLWNSRKIGTKGIMLITILWMLVTNILLYGYRVGKSGIYVKSMSMLET